MDKFKEIIRQYPFLGFIIAFIILMLFFANKCPNSFAILEKIVSDPFDEPQYTAIDLIVPNVD